MCAAFTAPILVGRNPRKTRGKYPRKFDHEVYPLADRDREWSGADLPDKDIDRVKSHLAKYYAKMGEEPLWDRDWLLP
jgi:hypothetical protein